jgi:hypothetical protein
MNCQIVNINSNILTLEIISTRVNSNFSIGQHIEIDKTQYLESTDQVSGKNSPKSFGKIVELSPKNIKLQLLRPELFILGKIVRLNTINQEILFLPQILNGVLVFGEKAELDSEQVFEFIPTVLVNQLVTQGQKIGYINSKTIHKQNFRHWILAHKSGKVNKIELGDYQIGQQVAVIDRSNLLLASHTTKAKAGNFLLKTEISPKYLSIFKNPTIDLKIITGQSNLILDINKRFLNTIPIESDQLGNSIFIFVTQEQDFVASSDLNSITYFDKYKLGQALVQPVTELALNICELGYNVVILTQHYLFLNCIGRYKTINGENVHITSIVQDYNRSNIVNRFDNVININ